MIKCTFKDILFLGVLNWIAIHSRTKNYQEIISTPCDGKVKYARVFQIQYSLQLTNTLKGGHLSLADKSFFTGRFLVKVS